MKTKLAIAVLLLSLSLLTQARRQHHTYTTRSHHSSGAALNGNVTRFQPPKSIAEQLFERYKPQPHPLPGRQRAR